jgi:hypothetical protein
MNAQVARNPRRRFSPAGTAILLAAAGIVFSMAVAPAQATDPSTVVATADGPPGNRASQPHPRKLTYLKHEWGIEVLYVRQTAAGYMLEFRYKVLDAEKAKPLFLRQVKPVLTHVESGTQLIVPTPAKTGALRNSNVPLAQHAYWMFFANPGKRVSVGDHVNITIGDFEVDGLVVRQDL